MAHLERKFSDELSRHRRTTLMSRRIVYLTGIIDEQIAHGFIADLKELENADLNSPITVMVDSYGGSVYSGNAMVAAIENCKNVVNTVCFGKAMSSGFHVFMAGKERHASRWANLLAHSANLTVSQMKTSDLKNYVGNLDDWYAMIAEYYASKTKMSREEWQAIFKGGIDRFFTGKQALKLGIITKIV